MPANAGIHVFVLPCLVAMFLAVFPAIGLSAPGDCGTIATEANNDITTFSPLFANSEGDSRAAQLLFQPLLWVDRYGQVDPARSIAEKIDVSPDDMRYTLTLRPWHWSDGRLVSATDVVFDWQLINRLGENYPDYGTGGIPQQIQSLTALDATHVQVVLKQPANPLWFIDNGLSQLVPLPAQAWARFSLAALFQNQSQPKFFNVTDGPMRIGRLDIGQDAIFLPNPHYDGPKPHLQRLVLIFEHSDGAALQQVEAGALDFAPVPMEFYGAVQNLPGLHLERLAPSSFFYFLSLNLRNRRMAFFRDVRVRQALQDALDQQAIIQLIYHGFGHAIYTPIPAVDADMLAPSLKQHGYPVGYDPAKARALLAAAGFSRGPDGIFQKNGQALSFTALNAGDSAENTELVVMVQAQLRAAGIEMKLHQVDFGEMLQVIGTEPQAWEAAEHGTVENPYPTGEGMFASNAGENEGGYSDPKMDRLIQASIAEPGMTGLYDYEIYAAAQQPVIFLATEDHLDLVSNRIHGVEGFSDGELLAPDRLYCTGR
jgi:peptide/nickel transport system substrate-binding protein